MNVTVSQMQGIIYDSDISQFLYGQIQKQGKPDLCLDGLTLILKGLRVNGLAVMAHKAADS